MYTLWFAAELPRLVKAKQQFTGILQVKDGGSVHYTLGIKSNCDVARRLCKLSQMAICNTGARIRRRRPFLPTGRQGFTRTDEVPLSVVCAGLSAKGL